MACYAFVVCALCGFVVQLRDGLLRPPPHVVDSQLRYTRASLLVADSRVLLERMAVRLRELTVLLPYYGSAERANARFHKFSRAKGGQHRALARAFPEGEVVYFGDGYRGGARRKGDRVGTNVKVGDACCDFALIPFF